MKIIYKIIIIIALIPIVVIGGQIMFLVGSIQIGGVLTSVVSDDMFDKEIKQLEEVKLFHEKYGESTVGHSTDIIAWKEIYYSVKSPDNNQTAEFFIKKNMLHGDIRMQFSCVYDIQSYQEYHINSELLQQEGNGIGFEYDDSEFALYLVDSEKILEHLKNKNCFSGIRD